MTKIQSAAFKNIKWLAAILALLLLSITILKFKDILWIMKTTSGISAFQTLRLQDAESQLKDALGVAESFGETDDRVVLSLNALGDLYMAQGKYRLAYPLIERGLNITEKRFGKDSLGTVPSLNAMAGYFRRQGDYVKAEGLYKRVLKIMETHDEEPLKYADELHALGSLLTFLGRQGEASQCLTKALEIKMKVLPADSLSIADTYSSLGDVNEAEGRYKSAEDCYKKSIDLYAKKRTPDHTDLARVKVPLTKLYLNEGEYDKAAPMADHSLRSLESQGGNEYLRAAILTALINKAKVFVHEGKLKEANSLLAHAEWVARERLSNKHPGVAQVFDVQSAIAFQQGDFEKTEKLLFQSRRVMQNALGEDHRWVALIDSRLAELRAAQGRNEEAEDLFRKALRVSSKAVGKLHPDYALILERYAAFKSKADRPLADKLNKEAADVRLKASSL